MTVDKPTDNQLRIQAAGRAELAARADELFERLPSAFSSELHHLMVTAVDKYAPEINPVRQQLFLTTLPEFIAIVATATREGWLDELLGRMMREAT